MNWREFVAKRLLAQVFRPPLRLNVARHVARSGTYGGSGYAEAACERLERLNPQLNAVIHPALDRARGLATSPELPDGPFRGVPFLMKDIGGDQKGQPYHAL